jgi:hypothetical protein
MGRPKYLIAKDSETNKEYYIYQIRKNKLDKQELKNRKLMCYCGCKTRIIFVGSGKSQSYFRSYGEHDGEHDVGETQLHKCFKNRLKELGAIIEPVKNNEDYKNWIYEPDAIFEELHLVIEGQTKNSGSSYKPHEVIERNDYYRKMGYTPVWVMLGYERENVLKRYNKYRTPKQLKQLSQFKGSVLWDNGGILNYAFNVLEENEKMYFSFVRYLKNGDIKMSNTGYSPLNMEKLCNIDYQWKTMLKDYKCDKISHKVVSISGVVK